MAIKALILTIPLVLITSNCFADSTLDAAIGGGIGGAAGAAIGNELGGRDGAILGAAIGGATGAAIATGDDHEHRHERSVAGEPHHAPASNNSQGSFCPPGQRKKGRC